MNSQAKLYRTVMAFSFVAYLGCLVLMNAFTPDRPFSVTENRVLEQIPSFSLQHLISGQFASDFERYMADQFTLRDRWIGLKAAVEQAIGKREINGVFIASDASLIQTFEVPNERDLEMKIEAINTFAASCPQLSTYLMLAPNSAGIYRDKLPRHAPVADQLRYLRQVYASLGEQVHFVDVYDALYSRRDQYLYYRTDHHWTTAGAFYAYQKLAEEMGEAPQSKDAYLVMPVADDFYGTSHSKSGVRNVKPDTIELYVPKESTALTVTYLDNHEVTDTCYNLSKLVGKDKYAVFLDGNHGLVRISSHEKRGKRLLVVKDSYANALIPFLSRHYGEIFVVDLRYYDDDLPRLIDDCQINDLLLLYNLDTFCIDASLLALADYATDLPVATASNTTVPSAATPSVKGIYADLFKNDLFIGDSISEGLAYYGYLPEELVAANKGLDFRTVRANLAIVRERQPQNIYILLGINVIGLDPETMAAEYASLIHDLKLAAPQASIYVQAILPVEPWVKEKRPAFDQTHIDACNAILMEMVKEERARFVNVAMIADAALHEDDGIHFKAAFYPLWLDYLVTQTKAAPLQGGSGVGQ